MLVGWKSLGAELAASIKRNLDVEPAGDLQSESAGMASQREPVLDLLVK